MLSSRSPSCQAASRRGPRYGRGQPWRPNGALPPCPPFPVSPPATGSTPKPRAGERNDGGDAGNNQRGVHEPTTARVLAGLRQSANTHSICRECLLISCLPSTPGLSKCCHSCCMRSMPRYDRWVMRVHERQLGFWGEHWADLRATKQFADWRPPVRTVSASSGSPLAG
jgi:hypothetical protein